MFGVGSAFLRKWRGYAENFGIITSSVAARGVSAGRRSIPVAENL